MLCNHFISAMTSNHIDYYSIYKNNKKNFFISNENRDINVFLPIRKREKFLIPCIQHLKNSAKISGAKIRIVLIENDEKPLFKDIAIKQNIDYIFIPKDVTKSEGAFAKSLCYNIGWIASKKTQWDIFHDIDILVEEGYFSKLLLYFKKKPNWIQPYTKKRVLRLSKEYTDKIVNENNKIFPLGLPGTFTVSNPGSPGGSIVVRNSDFEKIGGYDPELFWGYSPEDTFFWTKLEIIYANRPGNPDVHIKKFSTPFYKSATYADDPPIEVYHMDHPLMVNTNKKYNLMLDMLRSFWNFPNIKRIEIIQYKESVLKNYYNKIKKEING